MTDTVQAFPLATSLAQHPLAWWLAGMATGSVLALGCLAALRALRKSGKRWWPVALDPLQARWVLVGAMAASACALLLGGTVMAELAESWRDDSARGWGAFDDDVAAGLQAGASMAALQLFATLTHLGDKWTLSAVAVAVAAALWLRQHRLLAIGWMVALAGNALLTRVLKSLFERVRPEHLHGVATADGYSFPSGHTSASMVAFTMLAYLATRLLEPRWHAPVVVAAAAAIFTTGWSRVVLQVHYVSDVLAGWVLGGVWALCTVLIMESISHWRRAARPGHTAG
ncbi:phosphatase PAP2 family protein [Acidovorax sp. BL-A-41-H1]|uniref:phosphatase PAP2 family protein n=1 Tax=Acidovorax sp. BL-A-41-H1 TaxID=3421102 RepID=UPI003F79BADC